MHKYYIIIFLIISIFSYPIESQGNELKIALVNSPMATMEKKREGYGYGIISDIIILSCEKANLIYSPVFLPLKRAQRSFLQKEIPFIFGNSNHLLASIEEKNININYVPFFYLRGSYFFYKPNWVGPDDYEEYSDLRKYTLGVPRGYYLIPTYKSHGIKLELYNSIENATKMLISGRIDLLEHLDFNKFDIIKISDNISSSDFGFLKKESTVSITGITYYSDNKESDEIAQKFKKGLNIILENGEYHKIIQRYYQPEKIPQYQIDFINELMSIKN